jgi:membrane-bound lytic murein transglycosylase D
MRVKTLPIILLLFLSLPLFAQEPVTDTARGPVTLADDPVSSMLDSLADLTIFRESAFLHGTKNTTFHDDYIPYFSDSTYRERIADMNDQSPFEYVYNDKVRMFIDLYASRKRALTARIIGLSQIYFPLFEEQLDKYNMPLELKYLAVIESALNPIANSRAGAKGLWQFMYGTGKVYGLKVTSYVDDRFDPYKSTIAACEHLQDLYDIYGNWSLALAAYNSGAGNVNKAIRRAGGIKNFWTIYPYLPKETRSYVPAFIAASYLFRAAQHQTHRPGYPLLRDRYGNSEERPDLRPDLRDAEHSDG